MADLDLQLVCGRCNQPAGPLAWRCAACGGPLEIANLPPFDPAAIRQYEWSLWRYAAMLPTVRRFSLGEGMTPLIPLKVLDAPFLAKLEYLSPTHSYKDRGVAVMLNYLLSLGVESIVEDSSGNAGASVAAYAGGIGMAARIFVPASAPTTKKAQIARFGATVAEVKGSREDVTAACLEAAQEAGTAYASHAWSPLYLAGQMTCAWELWEQMGRRAPTAVVCPVGQGGLLLGMARGFAALHAAGLINRPPRLYAVQSAACDPLVRAWEAGVDEPRPMTGGHTLADGIKIGSPVRGREVLAALRTSDGAALRVEDEAAMAARARLAERGLFVEPTSAVAVAALGAVQEHLGGPAEIVIPLTGSGLKT